MKINELKKAGFNEKEIQEYMTLHPSGHTGEWTTPGYTGSWSPFEPKEIDESLKIAATLDIAPAAAYLSRDLFQKKVKETGHIPTAGKSFIAGIGDVYTGAADALDWIGFKDYSLPYRDFGKRLQMAYEIPTDPTEFTFDKILDPAWLSTNAIRAVPFTLSLIPAALVGAYGGGSAAGMVGFGAFGKVILGSIGASILSRPMESALEAGGTYNKILRETGDIEKAKSAGNNTFKLNMALTGLDAAELAIAFTPLKLLGKSATKSLLRRVLATSGKLAMVGLMEAGEEWYQDVAQEISTDVSWKNIQKEIVKMPPERKEAVSIGGLFGVGLGGTGSVYTSLKDRVTKTMPKEIKEIYDKALKETESDIEALDKVAETPEGETHIDNVIKKMKGEEPLPSKPSEAKPSEPLRKEIKPKVTLKPIPEEGKVITADQIAAERELIEKEKITNYEKLQQLATLRVVKNLEKTEIKEDKAALAWAKKRATEFVSENKIFRMVASVKKQGGLNRRSLETTGVSDEEVAKLTKKFPGLVKKEGKVYADKMAEEYGYDLVDEMYQEMTVIPSKKEMIEKVTKEEMYEYDTTIDISRDLTLMDRFLEEEIKVLNEMMGKKPKARKDLKKVIREKAGILKVGDVIEVKEQEALRDQIKLEARAARKAFSEGKKEATLQHKEKQRELVLKARERLRLRKRLDRIRKDLKGLKPDKMIPQFGKPVKDILDGIDLTKPTKKTLVKLGARKEFLERNVGYVDMPIKYIEELTRLEKISIRDMSMDELEDLYSAVMLYHKLDKNLKTIKVGRRDRQRSEVMAETMSLLKPQKKLEADYASSQIAGPGKMEFAVQIKDFFGLHQQHYNTVLEKLVGINTVPYKVLWTAVKEGVITKYSVNQKAADMLVYDAFQKKHKIKDLMKWKTEIVHPEGGMELIRDERTTLWRLAQNTDTLRHMLDGGVGFKFSSRPLDVHKVTKESLEITLDSLTKAELEYAKFPEEVGYFDYLFNIQAEVYLDVNMYPLKQVEGFYHPADVMPSEIGDIDIGEEPVLLEDHVIRIGIRKGQLIERVKSEKPIYLNPLTYDLNKARDVASKYVGLEKPLREASKLLYGNNRRFRKELVKRYDNGFEIWRNIEQALKDIAGQNQGHSQMGRWLLSAKNKLTTSILGYNPFSYVIQIPSSMLYTTYVKPEYYFRGVHEALTNPKEIVEKHMRYDPEFRERVEGGYSRDVMDAIKDLQKKKYFDDKELVSFGMKGLKLADLVAVTPGMQGAVLQALDEFEAEKMSASVKMALDMKDSEIVELSPERKMELAYDFARWCTERSQPMFSPEHRSAWSRGAAPYQMATMFGAYISGARNLIERAAIHAQRTKTPEAYNALAMSLFGVFVLNTLAVLARDDLRDYLLKRKQKPWTVARIARVWTSYIFILRDVSSSVINKLERGTWVGKDPELPIERVGEIFTDATTHGLNMVIGPAHKREENAEKFVDKSIEFFLMTRGIPYRTPKAMITAPFKERKK